MTNQEDIPTLERINITLQGESVADIKQLRKLLEARLDVRLSIAEVVRHLTKQALSAENKNHI